MSAGSVSSCLLPDDTKNFKADWRSWCRLCAKDDSVGNINILFKDEQQPDEMDPIKFDLSLAAAIKKYFRINITREDALPKMICTDCFSLVTSVVNFSERVTKVQNMFAALLDTTECTENSLHATRLKFGILDADREHLMIQTPPEVHFFESKQKINELEENIFETETTNLNPLAQPHNKIRIKNEKSLDMLINNEESVEDGQEDPFVSDKVDTWSPGENYNSSNEEATIAEAKLLDSKVGSSDKRKFKMFKLPANDKTSIDNDVVPKKIKRKRRTRIQAVDEKIVQSEQEADSNVQDDFACIECPRRFKRLHNFKEHVERTHSKKTSISVEKKCTQCSSIFSTDYELKMHSKTHEQFVEKKMFPCTYCGKMLTSQSSVRQHIKHIHMNERPYVCEECGVAKHTSAALKEHMLTHTDYAPFECEVCQKCFKTHKALNKHSETHSPTKHTCPQCGLQLKTSLMLSRHMIVHSDKMNHICDYCGRAFKRSKSLKLHRFLHTGMPFSCDFCDRTFSNRSFCRAHRRKSHPEELEALEATGIEKTFTRNIPELQAFKAFTKATDSLEPDVKRIVHI